MIVFPNAKINLGLNITKKRPDGYHDLSSCFLPIGWKDALEIIPSAKFAFSASGLPIPGHSKNNLCIKAYDLLAESHSIAPVQLHLHKVIPMGAGLGGGSSDAAFTLKSLNEMFELNLSNDALRSYAKQLGADCPFFIDNQPKLVTGIGEIMANIKLDLSDHQILVVFPSIHINTKAAFEDITPHHPNQPLANLLSQPIPIWQSTVCNDFEEGVMRRQPEIGEIKNMLLNSGAQYASMTGTGSAVYGIYKKDIALPVIDSHMTWCGAMQ